MKRMLCVLLALMLAFQWAVLPADATEKTSLRETEEISAEMEPAVSVETEAAASGWVGFDSAASGELFEISVGYDAMLGVNDQVVQEQEPNDSPDTAMPLHHGDTVVGALTQKDMDAYWFNLEAKIGIVALIAAESESVDLYLADAEGAILYQSIEMDPQGGVYGDVLSVTLDPGTYYLIVMDGNGTAGEYTFYFESHFHSYVKYSKPASCTEGGYDIFRCEECGDSYEANHTDPLGHSYTDDQDDSCNVCGHVRNLTVPSGTVSGDLDQEAAGKHAILSKWKQIVSYSSVYAQTPSVKAPYSIGKLSDSFLNNGLSALNFMRYVARLPQLQLDQELNESAQYGAVLNAANKTLSHYPAQPSDMDKEFYDLGRYGASSSNLSMGYSNLQKAVQGWMDDKTGSANLDSLGHRRWLLNPWLKYVGFGFAQSNSHYAAAKVFDTSGGYVEFDFIAWPASGNFPNNVFGAAVPWSISLNNTKYQEPRLDQVEITLTRVSDGKKWTFDVSTGSQPNVSKGYFTVDTGGYGINNCLIFHPGTNNLSGQYSGSYTVDVSGIYLKEGGEAQLHYQVDFFDLNSESVHDYQVSGVTAPTCTAQGYTTYACQCGASYKDHYVPVADHSYQAAVTAPTCTKDGYTDHVCQGCGHSYRDSYTNRTGHVYDNDQDTTCNVCGSVRELHIPSVPMFRMYDPNSSEHFYTGSAEERDNLVAAGWNYEGVGFNFPVVGEPVYRLYEPKTGEHLYTMSKEEKAALLAAGWNYEGVAFNSAKTDEVPQYRLHNPNASRGAYHFTGSEQEKQDLLDAGWEYQGIGWYSCLK